MSLVLLNHGAFRASINRATKVAPVRFFGHKIQQTRSFLYVHNHEYKFGSLQLTGRQKLFNVRKLYQKTNASAISLLAQAESSGLRPIFEPKSVAVIGATDRASSVGRTLISNLIEGNKQSKTNIKIYPVNPTRKEVLGLKCYQSLESIPDSVELVVIVTPAKTCLDVMNQCAKKKVKAAIVISAGFKEVGPSGIKLERDMIDIARKAGIRIIGPNCVGVMNPNYGVNATFAATMGLPGNVAFISQSGAMCTAILDWSLKEKIGFSTFVSMGSMADVNWGDLLHYLHTDPQTSSILIYMETIGDINAFIGAAEKICIDKPIVVLKAGKSDAAAQAAASHTGSLAGSYASFEAAMHRVGVLTTSSIQELSDITLFLSKQPRPKGPKIMIVTNAGGPAVLATDAAIASGAELATLSADTIEKLNAFLPSAWSHNNPVDILGDAPAELYSKTLEVLKDDANSDAVLIVLSPQDVTDSTGTAKALIDSAQRMSKNCVKPVLAAWMGGDSVKEGFDLLSQAGIPVYTQPDTAASVFGKIWTQVNAIKTLYGKTEYKSVPYIPENHNKVEAMTLINKVRENNRYLLTESESKQLLELYEIKGAQTIVANSQKEVSHAIKKIAATKYAVKLNSKTLTHKADVGGVKLSVLPNEVDAAFDSIKDSVISSHGAEHFQGVSIQPMINLENGIELILGSTIDPQFGPVFLFGSGGTMVEIFKDTALAIPPLTDNLAEDLIKRTKIYKALKGGSGKRFPGVDICQLKLILSKFSHMIVDLAEVVAECDINPLLATADGSFIALDARVVLKKRSDLPTLVARRPYPTQYVHKTKLPNLGEITIRPAIPSDKEAICQFHLKLSPDTVMKSYLEPISHNQRTNFKNLIPLCYSDFDRQFTMVAIHKNQIIAIGELERPPAKYLTRHKAQFRIVTADEFQKKGVSTLMTQNIMEIAKLEQIKEIYSLTTGSNTAFKKLLARLGWETQESLTDENVVIMSFKV